MVKIKIDGDGLSFERETELQKAAQIIAFLSADNNLVQNSSSSADVGKNLLLSEKRKSINEILNNSNAKTFPEKIIVLAKYICDIQGQDHFNPEEIKPLFSKAKISAPKNFKRDFESAISQGYLDEDFNNAGCYFLTQTGEGAINNNFSEKIKKHSSNKKNKNLKKMQKSNSIKVDEIDILEKDGIESLSDFLDSKELENSAIKRITVMAFYFKNRKNIDKFNIGNIEYVYRALNLNKKPLNLKQALIDCKNKKQYINNDDKDNWYITALGESFVKNLPSKNE